MVQCGAWWCRFKEDCVIISANFLEALLNFFQQNWYQKVALYSGQNLLIFLVKLMHILISKGTSDVTSNTLLMP